MSFVRKLRYYIQYHLDKNNKNETTADEPRMIAEGWDQYAREWQPVKFPVFQGHHVQYLGDEWTAEDVSAGGTTYGLSPEIIANFDEYINEHLLNSYLPSCSSKGLEIGPGGGRLTVLLVPRTKELYLAEPSKTMLKYLKQRFTGVSNLHYHHTDGMTLPKLQPESLDYVIAFDVFVHFEPRLIYWYLRQIVPLLKPGGIGIIHYANILTRIGWQQFEMDVDLNVQHRTHFAAFGVMCPQLMAKFLEAFDLEVISTNIGIIPRDAVAVFRKLLKDESRVS